MGKGNLVGDFLEFSAGGAHFFSPVPLEQRLLQPFLADGFLTQTTYTTATTAIRSIAMAAYAHVGNDEELWVVVDVVEVAALEVVEAAEEVVVDEVVDRLFIVILTSRF
jgi:hypothetical protein